MEKLETQAEHTVLDSFKKITRQLDRFLKSEGHTHTHTHTHTHPSTHPHTHISQQRSSRILHQNTKRQTGEEVSFISCCNNARSARRKYVEVIWSYLSSANAFSISSWPSRLATESW